MAHRLLPQIAPGEQLRLFCGAGGFMCIASAALVARSAGDTLFLSCYDASLLPWMYVGSAIVIMMVSYLYGIGSCHLSIGPLTCVSTALLIALTLAMRLLLTLDYDPVRVAAYFLADLVVNLTMLFFWGLVAFLFDLRESKRLLGLIGSAGTAACIGLGLLIGPIAHRIGVESLFLVVGALLTVFLALVGTLVWREPGRLRQEPRALGRGKASGQYASLLKMQQLRNLAFYTMVMTVVLVTVDFIFKYSARQSYEGAELAGFFGNFYGCANILALIIQLFAVHRILNRLGLMVALLILPIGITAASIGLAVRGAFGWVLTLKAVDPVLNFTVNSAATQMLYLGIKKQSRSRARAFVDGVCKPLAMALAGVILVTVPRAPGLVRGLAMGIAVTGVVWLVSAWLNHRAFMAGLIESVGAKTVELGQIGSRLSDPTLRNHFQNSLLSAADEDVPYLAALVAEIGDIDVTEQFRQLLRRPSPSVRVAALGYLRDHGTTADLVVCTENIAHPDASVRLAAVQAVAACAGEEAMLALEGRLEDVDDGVRAASAAELMNVGDIDAFLAAGTALKQMLRDGQTSPRVAATVALSSIKTGGLTRLLASALADPDDEVRIAALHGFRLRPSPHLVPNIVNLLGEGPVGSVAADTLAGLGSTAIPHLDRCFDEALQSGNIAAIRRFPGLVARVGSPSGMPLLRRALTIPELRVEAVTALCQFIAKQSSASAFRAELDAAIEQDMLVAERHLDALERVLERPATTMLLLALRDKLSEHTGNVFRLLGVRAPTVNMSALFAVLDCARPSGESRGQALEVLDNLLEAPIRARLIRLVEPPQRRVDANCLAPETFLLDSWSDWIVVGALHALSYDGYDVQLEAVETYLKHPSGVVRETALYVLSRRSDANVVAQTCQQLQNDSDTAVRRLCAQLVASQRTSSAGLGARENGGNRR